MSIHNAGIPCPCTGTDTVFHLFPDDHKKRYMLANFDYKEALRKLKETR